MTNTTINYHVGKYSNDIDVGFAVCHLSAVVFYAEGVLRARYGLPIWITYGLLHFVWRLLGGVGLYLIVSEVPPMQNRRLKSLPKVK